MYAKYVVRARLLDLCLATLITTYCVFDHSSLIKRELPVTLDLNDAIASSHPTYVA